MGTKSASYIRGKSMRATKLDSCGNPVIGAESVVVTKGYVQIAFTANTDEGSAIEIKNADDERCIYQPAEPKFVSYGVEVQFCNVDPDVFSMLTGQRTVIDHRGDVVGFTVDSSIKVSTVNFALECWAGTPSGDSCGGGATTEQYGYFGLPFMQGGTVGDFTLQNGEVTFTVTGAVTKDGNRFGKGLHKIVLNATDQASLLVDGLVATDHLIMLLTGMAPPVPHIGARPYLDPVGAAVTSATATATLKSVVFAPTPSGVDPFWIDYGDGVWSYSADGASKTHVYAVAGTYPYVVYRGSTSYTATITVA